MTDIGAFAFTDPEEYQAAVHPAQVEILVTSKGDFKAELTRVQLPRLWLQWGRERLPRIVHSTVSSERPPLFFLDSDQPAIHHSGINVSFGEIVAVGSGSTHHHRSWSPCHWATMSLMHEDLVEVEEAFIGRDMTFTTTQCLRPAPRLMGQLLKLHGAVGQLAEASPHVLAHPEVARSLEQALVHAMIRCITDDIPAETVSRTQRQTAILARFEEYLAENQDSPLYLADICSAISVPERTLRRCCHEHLGMSPGRYLWLRRMHLTRRALILASPEMATVASIAMDHGFWELGRFSGEYQTLFGELPSTSLSRRPSSDRHTSHARLLALPLAKSA